ncbi:CYTH domain-containing protein [Halomonas aquamarina]|uniref:CYTH domain-containing protein n=1 Tax=Vreelandella aquamarina TaxID=77097 RepID=A0ACC5VSX1_9GAMM|nr:CYTH domain-containing protein [Halomonas aquamarina]MBZ5487237.1 CYTH domain-containing protein [Halomonas aquamarina]
MENATPIEVELKLALAPGGAEALMRHPELMDHPPLVQSLANRYYDTPDDALARARIALRLRQVDTQVLQTVKTAGQGGGGLSSRQEWEWPVERTELDREGLAALPPFKGELGGQLERLAPRLRTDFTRHSWQLEWQGSHIELVLDQGEIESGMYTTPICEVELELKAGAPEALWSLALALAERVPLRPSDSSKAARGAALRAQQWPLPDARSPGQWLHRATLALDAFHDSQHATYLQDAREALEQLAGHPELADDLKAQASCLPAALDDDGQPGTACGVTLLTLSHRLALQSALS